MDYYNKPPPLSYLYHHGIKGQRWGVRRFQNKDGSLTSAGRRRYNESDSKRADDSEAKKKGLSDKQKRAIKIGAAVAVTAIAAIGVYQLNKHGKLDSFKELGKNKLDELLGSKKSEGIDFGSQPVKNLTAESAASINGFRKLSKPETISEAVTKVNPSGSRTNCRACSIASVLRMRGMDVEALGSVKGGSLREAVESCFKGAKVTEIYSPSQERVTNRILKHFGEGSSGVMSARYKMPDGHTYEHATSWMVKDGKVTFFDGQKGLSDFSRYWKFLSPDGSVELARIDDLELNLDGIKNFVKNRR